MASGNQTRRDVRWASGTEHGTIRMARSADERRGFRAICQLPVLVTGSECPS